MKWKILKHFKCNFSCDLEKKIELSLCDAKNVAEIKVENLEIYADMNMNSSRMNTQDGYLSEDKCHGQFLWKSIKNN